MSRIVVVLTVVSVMITSAFATTQIVKGPMTPQITPQSTGIYSVAVLHRDARVYQSLALFHQGQMKEIHTRVQGGPYLRRRPGSTAIRIQPATFDQLIATAGGVDRNVEQLPLAQRNRFYQLAGLAVPTPPGTPSRPPEVAPDTAGHCPQGYELRPFPKPAKCVLISEAPQPNRNWLVAGWSGSASCAKRRRRSMSSTFPSRTSSATSRSHTTTRSGFTSSRASVSSSSGMTIQLRPGAEEKTYAIHDADDPQCLQRQ